MSKEREQLNTDILLNISSALAMNNCLLLMSQPEFAKAELHDNIEAFIKSNDRLREKSIELDSKNL